MLGRIAVLEDNEDCRQILGILFASEYLVDGFDQAEKLKSALIDTRYDLLIVDLIIEGRFAGVDVLRHVRSIPKLKNLPVILLTGDIMRFDREKALQTGFDGFVVKPFEFEELKDTVSRLLRTGGSFPLRATA